VCVDLRSYKKKYEHIHETHGVFKRQRRGTLTITKSIGTLTTDVEIAVYQEIVNRVRKYARDSENILKKEYRTSHNSTNLANRDTGEGR
jgi:hypothetical protein